MSFKIVCDSAADLTEAYARENNVTVIPYYVSCDGQTYKKEGTELAPGDLYKFMAENPDVYPKTSMPTIQDYMDAFTPAAEAGEPVLCICLTHKFSGSYQSAVNAKELLEEDFEDAEICVMDSHLVTALEGALVCEAVRLRDAGCDLKTAVQKLEEIRPTGEIFFTTKDLKYLHHGGRLNAAAYVAGSVLNIKPLLHFNDGNLELTSVCRGRKNSLNRLIDTIMAYLKEHQIHLEDYVVGVGIGLEVPECEEFYNNFVRRLEEGGYHPGSWIKMRIGATIGVHTGPYPIGLGLMKRAAL